MKKILSVLVLTFFLTQNAIAQVGIGTNTPAASAQLDVTSTTKGFVPPRMTTAERNAIVNPADGLQIYNTTTGCINYYFSSIWKELCPVVNTPSNFGTFYSTTIQSSLTTKSQITLDQTAISNGLSLVDLGKSIKFSKGGVYNVKLSVNAEISRARLKFWLAKNYVSLPWSAKRAQRRGGSIVLLESTLEYTVSMGENDSLQFYFVRQNPTNEIPQILNLESISPGGTGPTGPGAPSVIVSIQQLEEALPAPSSTSMYAIGAVFCNASTTTIIDVTNPTTGKTWMDRNLGASQVATSSSDAAAYGDLYQWGRRSDGHQCRTSATTSSLSSNDQPTDGLFIISQTAPNDWRATQNNLLWQGSSGINNPCPVGYRLPTETEFENERLSWITNTNSGAFNSPLKITLAGYKLFGNIFSEGAYGNYWTSTVNGTSVRNLNLHTTGAGLSLAFRSYGMSVRCIKN